MIHFSHPILLIAGAVLLVGIVISRRFRAGDTLRLLTVFTVLVALAGPQIGEQHPFQTVTFLVDRSPSVSATTTPQEVSDQVAAIVAANPGFRFSAIAFADQAVVTNPIGEGFSGFTTEVPLGAVPLGEATDLNHAIKLAFASLPEGGTHQFVLVSDGRITDGLDAALAAAQRAGIPISTLPIGGMATADASLASLNLPQEVEVNRPFVITIRILSQGPGEGILALYRDDALIASREISLVQGTNSITLTDSLVEGGAHSYRALVRRSLDPIPENDALSAMIQTVDRPRLLVVGVDEEGSVEALLNATPSPPWRDWPSIKRCSSLGFLSLHSLPWLSKRSLVLSASSAVASSLSRGRRLCVVSPGAGSRRSSLSPTPSRKKGARRACVLSIFSTDPRV
jgi:hypothetical protein